MNIPSPADVVGRDLKSDAKTTAVTFSQKQLALLESEFRQTAVMSPITVEEANLRRGAQAVIDYVRERVVI
ncbi:hypothetical protein Axy21_030 [Achromobacter phage vB_AxyP_19-32_Axy21]|uniref:Uncharacterized protein n=1 Tax=Achromobacter phage vB_AxyP_19-32_Axy21 TaxID=2591045 RepID=A0A514CVS3_9CAUD|nr:hypothetical protein Axy21_030 [Achromobacter phage vB_AxyP_19-32_Axy21]